MLMDLKKSMRSGFEKLKDLKKHWLICLPTQMHLAIEKLKGLLKYWPIYWLIQTSHLKDLDLLK